MVQATYTNWKGETALRTLTPTRIHFGATEFHPVPQWLVDAHDHDKQVDRTFALAGFSIAGMRESVIRDFYAQ